MLVKQHTHTTKTCAKKKKKKGWGEQKKKKKEAKDGEARKKNGPINNAPYLSF